MKGRANISMIEEERILYMGLLHDVDMFPYTSWFRFYTNAYKGRAGLLLRRHWPILYSGKEGGDEKRFTTCPVTVPGMMITASATRGRPCHFHCQGEDLLLSPSRMNESVL